MPKCKLQSNWRRIVRTFGAELGHSWPNASRFSEAENAFEQALRCSRTLNPHISISVWCGYKSSSMMLPTSWAKALKLSPQDVMAHYYLAKVFTADRGMMRR